MSHADSNTSAQPFLHGTKADLEPGDLIKVGYKPNFATTVLGLLHARWMRRPGVQNWPLVRGGGRIYLVEPTGPFEDDPNFTGKKFPGNPTQSYRSREPLRVIGEVTDWQPHMVEQLQQMKDGLARLRAEGKDVIID